MKIYQKISRIFVSLALFGMILSSVSLGAISLNTKRAEAQFATFDAGNFVQNTLTALGTTAEAYNGSSLQVKEYILDGVVYMLAKALIRNVTTSIVNWINSGFEGSPAFVTNPGQFFANIGDELVGEFISNHGDLAFLCSPFSIDLRLALAFKYRPNVRNRMACTLSQVIANSQGAIENASINGFTRGDFRQGGWPAFIALTQEPQNNVYGAYIEAESILSARIADKVVATNNDLNRGRGFLSWEECVEAPVEGSNTVSAPSEWMTQWDSQSQIPVPLAPSPAPQVPLAPQVNRRCTTKTPGSVIAGTLDTQLGIPAQELALADEFNEIINALFAQLVTQILNKGLATVSGSGPSDLNAYINQLQAQNSQTNEQLNSLKAGLNESVEPYLTRARDYQAQARIAFNSLNTINQKFDEARACYQQKLSPDYQPPLSQSNKERAQTELAELIGYVNQNLATPLSEVNAFVNDADRRVQQLEDIKNRATNATLVEDFNTASTQFANLVQAQALTSPIDVQRAIEKRQAADTLAGTLKTEADIAVRDCLTFPQRR